MKKIINWFTKKSKIVRILRYVYRGSYVMHAIILSAKESLIQTQPAGEQNEKIIKVINGLETCISFLNSVNEALEKILEWVGKDELEANNNAVLDTLTQAAVGDGAVETVPAVEGETVQEGGEKSFASTRGAGFSVFQVTTVNALDTITDKLWDEI